MKFLSNKQMKKIAKSTLAMVIAGAFTFSSSLAYANEVTDDVDHYERIDLQNLISAEEETIESDVDMVKGTEEAEDQLEVIQSETPSLLPGNIFYFAKIALEKIKLALTFNDVKEAKLLATYAAERIAESEALFKEGKEAEAQETIERALEYMEDAEFILGEEISLDHEEESRSENNENNTVFEDVETIEEDTDVKEDESVEEVEELVSQNIIALQAAMNKVKNPVAKTALQKNIDKSYAKLAKKLEKLEEKQAVKASKRNSKGVVTTEDGVSVEEELTIEIEPTTETNIITEAESTIETNQEAKGIAIEPKATTEVPVNLKNEGKPNVIAEKKEVQQLTKQHKTQLREETKQARETAKQEAKELKQEVKQQKEQFKQSAKQEKEVPEGKGKKGNEE
ncbi:hypothetical protein JMM81_20990 [Bacillus sp. V3B]|uniref:DUF5667 domain-containing protein n=1 Tax=Bacillus sp. V3B TaxID=2804915 RepID=UPI00210D9BF1|nr:DUF5667 domain-containing protein [Bacillus sp. V3B]MCQ6277352.1 hypothetical protein [Bacillus sp. V3B]